MKNGLIVDIFAGGQPRSAKLRSLAWVGHRWAGQVMPDVISLENVTQIIKWGPLIAKRDKHTGRVIKLDGNIAADFGAPTTRERLFMIARRDSKAIVEGAVKGAK